MASLVLDAGSRERLGRKARDRIIGEFALGKVIDEYAAVYLKVAAASSAA
jgi:hypothetical protein